MSLHLIRLQIDLPGLARAAADRGWTKGPVQSFDEGAALHHMLGESFGPGVLQPFRLLVPPRSQRGNLYAYADRSAEDLAETVSQVALPEARQALALDTLEGKAMPSSWEVGKRLGFDLRARPTVRLASAIVAGDGEAREKGFAKGAEVDAFLAQALRQSADVQDQGAATSRETVYASWLTARLSGSAEIEDVRLAKFRRTRAARTGRAQEGPDATLHGVLRIADPAKFAERLSRGIGRHRAYGYGMLLLRPTGAATLSQE